MSGRTSFHDLLKFCLYCDQLKYSPALSPSQSNPTLDFCGISWPRIWSGFASCRLCKSKIADYSQTIVKMLSFIATNLNLKSYARLETTDQVQGTLFGSIQLTGLPIIHMKLYTKSCKLCQIGSYSILIYSGKQMFLVAKDDAFCGNIYSYCFILSVIMYPLSPSRVPPWPNR